MKDISLVIQGPSQSRSYDCTENIKRLADDYANKVDSIVLSTWESDRFTAPALACDFFMLRNRLPEGADRRNRLRQWLSSYEGTKFIRDNVRSRFVLKMRTDQYVHPRIIDFLLQFYDSHTFVNGAFQGHYLLFCYVHRNIPFHTGDFYFGGLTSDVENLLRSAVSYGDEVFQEAAELDLMLKYLKKNDTQFPIPFWILYKQMALPEKFSKSSIVWDYWLTQYSERFACFSRDIFSTLEWRGVKSYGDMAWNYKGNQVCQTYFDYYDEWLMVRNNRNDYLALPVEAEQHVRWLYDWLFFLWLLSKKVTRNVGSGFTNIFERLGRARQQVYSLVKRHEQIKRLALAIRNRLP